VDEPRHAVPWGSWRSVVAEHRRKADEGVFSARLFVNRHERAIRLLAMFLEKERLHVVIGLGPSLCTGVLCPAGRTSSGRFQVLDAEQTALASRTRAFRVRNRPRHLGEGVRREGPVFREDLRHHRRVEHPLGRVEPVGQPHLLSDEYPARSHGGIVTARASAFFRALGRSKRPSPNPEKPPDRG
jgi:hypothetical protein